MDEKTKLYVFEKKEVFLIFIFMILIAVTSFVLGVRVGKSYSFKQAGFSQEDRQTVDLLSGQEEAVNKIVDETGEGIDRDTLKESMDDRLEKRIMNELDGTQPVKQAPANDSISAPEKKNESEPVVEPKEVSKPIAPVPTSLKDKYSGKYTIQLGSYRTVKEAEDFANGFKIKGYNPIINEVEIQGRGRWFRVSLGVFDNLASAKDYVVKEKELFMGQDYVFGQFE